MRFLKNSRFFNTRAKMFFVPAGLIAFAALLLSVVAFAVLDVMNPPEMLPPEIRPDNLSLFNAHKEIEYEPEPYDPRPLSILTGLPVDEEYANRRPVAVIINNIGAAWPQSGLLSADIIYEVLTEGDVTRFVAIFQTEIPEKIGPVRSTRTYFADMALNHDAIFIHHGGTPDGYARLANLRMDRMDGIALEGQVFWRDRNYPEWTGLTGQRALEHSSYTSWERISARMEAQEMRGYIGDDPGFGFTFGEVPPEIRPAGKTDFVLVPYSRYTRTFVFEPDYGHYRVYNRSGEHRDAETMEQMVTHNILVQITQKRVLDAIGYRAVDTVGNGRGYFAANGRFFEVRWEKTSHESPMRWYFLCGTPLVLTPGKTWVNVLQSTASVVWEAPE